MVSREKLLRDVRINGLRLGHVPSEFRNDRGVVLAACNQNGWALCDASAALRDDREVVLAACNQNGWALQYASAALQADREVVMVAAAECYDSYANLAWCVNFILWCVTQTS